MSLNESNRQHPQQSIQDALLDSELQAAQHVAHQSVHQAIPQQQHTALLVLQRARQRAQQQNLNGSRVTPTRTLRLTEAEVSSPGVGRTLHLTLESLSSRPRSNPHSRTPMRYESPLLSGEFRRTEGTYNNERRFVAGSGADHNTSDVRRSSRSSKQGHPSHRKVRRWTNEHFNDLAAELAKATSGNPWKKSSSSTISAAEVLRQASKDAHLYRSVYDPSEHKPSSEMEKFLYGTGTMARVREQFFEGIDPSFRGDEQQAQNTTRDLPLPDEKILTFQDCLDRIDPRLRRVLEHGCASSCTASIAHKFETFLLSAVHCTNTDKPSASDSTWWKGLLLVCPTVSHLDDGKRMIQFMFESSPNKTKRQTMNKNNSSTNTSSGYHRLILHAIAQFHGFHTKSCTVQLLMTDTNADALDTPNLDDWVLVPQCPNNHNSHDSNLTPATQLDTATTSISTCHLQQNKNETSTCQGKNIEARALLVVRNPLDNDYKLRLIPYLEQLASPTISSGTIVLHQQ